MLEQEQLDYLACMLEINFFDMQEGLTVSSVTTGAI